MTIDLTGQTFGSLTVLGRDGEKAHSRWSCRCVCGKTVTCLTHNLRVKKTDKCGCSMRSAAIVRQTRHGFNRSPEHRTWSNMKNRCENPANRSYARYGARGITVDPRWQSFEAFLADMGPRPSPKHSLDRYPNQNGPYSPDNCRWASRSQQNNNKSNNHPITFRGRTMNLNQWAKEVGISEDAIERRINLLGWPVEKALTKPVRYRGW